MLTAGGKPGGAEGRSAGAPAVQDGLRLSRQVGGRRRGRGVTRPAAGTRSCRKWTHGYTDRGCPGLAERETSCNVNENSQCIDANTRSATPGPAGRHAAARVDGLGGRRATTTRSSVTRAARCPRRGRQTRCSTTAFRSSQEVGGRTDARGWLTQHPRRRGRRRDRLVERWFVELTNRTLRRSAHRGVAELEADVEQWIDAWNHGPEPFIWTKTADEVLDKLARYGQPNDDSGHQARAAGATGQCIRACAPFRRCGAARVAGSAPVR